MRTKFLTATRHTTHNLEPGCGFVREDPAETTFVPFTAGNADWDATKATDHFGSCGMVVQKAP